MTALNEVIRWLDDVDSASFGPSDLHDFATRMLNEMASTFRIVEEVWFQRKGLTEEEILRRFLQ